MKMQQCPIGSRPEGLISFKADDFKIIFVSSLNEALGNTLYPKPHSLFTVVTALVKET